MDPLPAIALVFFLGIGAQWLAWRFRLPSILLLLVFGFIAGPVSGLITPQNLDGSWLFPLVSLAVGIILFEGGLTLRISELREIGKAVVNLITIGVLVTGVLAAIAAYYLVGFGWPMAIITGAILTVTGPTVVIPLLRHIRPTGKVATIAKWEGITIDPVGAILAVLVFEGVMILYGNGGGHGAHAEGVGGVLSLVGTDLLRHATVGVGAGAIGAAIMYVLLSNRWLPDYLINPVALMVVIGVFAISDMLQEESGLISTTLMGIMLANQKQVSVQRIVAFKEDLRVLLISMLFIALSARLEPEQLRLLGWGSLVFLAVLLFVVRPLAVVASTVGTDLSKEEKTFLSWMAPRGIVAAAVASLFGFRLADVFPEQAPKLVPIVFLVIVGTVAIYGLTAGPLARWLGLAHPNPQGVLFVGAHKWARKIAVALSGEGVDVLMVDTNADNIAMAKSLGLATRRANVLADGVLDELPLRGIGRLAAVTPNEEVNSLVTLHLGELFDSAEIYQLRVRSIRAGHDEDELTHHLRGRPLFGHDVTFGVLSSLFDRGAEVKTVEVSSPEMWRAMTAEGGDHGIPLFAVSADGNVTVVSGKDVQAPQIGDRVLVVQETDSDNSREVGTA